MNCLLVKIYQKWSVKVGLKEAKTLLNPKRSIIGNAATVSGRNLVNHYGIFVAHLETLFFESCKKRYPSILDRKEIIQSILKKESIALLSNFKTTIHLICIACRKPVITIWKTLQIQHSLSEIVIAENGPLLHHADEILARAMNQYWRVGNSDSKWHFNW